MTDQEQLRDALIGGKRDVVVGLLDRGVAPAFAPASDPQLIDVLIDAGGDPSRSMESGDTPLEAAAGLGYTAVVKRLLKHGAAVTERAIENATRRGFSGALLALEAGDGADLGRSLDEQILRSSPVPVVRLLSERELLTVSHDSVLVRWTRASSTGEFVPQDWQDLDQNKITWIEVGHASSSVVLLACGEGGVVSVDPTTAGATIASVQDEPAAQVVLSESGRAHFVAERHARNPEFQAAWFGERLLRLHEGPYYGDDPAVALSLFGADPDSPEWEWIGGESGAVRPTAMAISAQHACVHHVTGSGEQRASVVAIGGAEVATATLPASRLALPTLQSVAAIDDAFAVVAGGDVVMVHSDATVVDQHRFGAPAIAVETRYGQRVAGTASGLRQF